MIKNSHPLLAMFPFSLITCLALTGGKGIYKPPTFQQTIVQSQLDSLHEHNIYLKREIEVKLEQYELHKRHH